MNARAGSSLGLLGTIVWLLGLGVGVAIGENASISAHGADRWYTYEEWYDWHPYGGFQSAPDGGLTVRAHFVGPMAVTPRGVYVRLQKGTDLGDVRLVIRDHTSKPIPTEYTPIDVRGCPDDRQWIRLGLGSWARGFAPLTLTADGTGAPSTRRVGGGRTGVPRFDYLLISPNLRYLTHGRAEQWIREHEAGREIRCGVPLGGIGAGKIELCRDGRFRNITINNNIDAPFYRPPLCFMALFARDASGAQARALSTEPVMGLQPVEDIEFQGRYPTARLRFVDRQLPISVELTAFSPIVPYDVDDSSLPAVVFDFELHNPGRTEIDAAVAISWENLLGCGGRPQPSRLWAKTGHYVRWRRQQRNTQERIDEKDVVGIRFVGLNKDEKDSEGNYALLGPVRKDLTYSVLSAYGDEPASRHEYSLTRAPTAPRAAPGPWAAFATQGRFPGPASATEGTGAALAVRTTVPPGQTTHVPLALAWHLPHHYQMGQEDMGHYYANRFDSSHAAACYVLSHRESLWARTRAWHGLFAHSTLPEWLQDMLINDAYVLATNTWLTRDGRFSVNEGATNMYGVMGTLDQKLYASHFYTLFFPSLQKQELLHFATRQAPSGEMPHDLGCGYFRAKCTPLDWPDLVSAFIILSYQYYHLTGDAGFWAQVRPGVAKAIRALHTARDPQGQGIPTGGSTFDDEWSLQMMSYHASLWLCSL